jgi:hypothetical protein
MGASRPFRTSCPGTVCPAEITLEDAAILRIDAALPRDLPLGYHTLRYRDSARGIRLIVSPGRCYLPDPCGFGDGRLWSIRSGLLEVGVWVTLATCGVVSATLDDALAVEERPNMPVTVVFCVSDTRQRVLSYPVPFN